MFVFVLKAFIFLISIIMFVFNMMSLIG